MIAVDKIAAVHMSPFGPSRHFAAMQRFSRTWSEADIDWQPKPADPVENDPSRILVLRALWPCPGPLNYRSKC